MSVIAAHSNISLQHLEQRKRTSSFSYPHQPTPFAPNPRPAKAPRVAAHMGSTLRRTESYLSLSDIRPASTTTTTITTRSSSKAQASSDHLVTSHRSWDRERRKVQVNRSMEPITIRIRADPSPQPFARPPGTNNSPRKPTTYVTCSRQSHIAPNSAVPTLSSSPRKSSPLAPTRSTLSSRPMFPRSRPEPDLYRKALKTSMKNSPEGQNILRMGARYAISIMTATKELERVVAAHALQECSEPQDIVMADASPPPPPPLSAPVASHVLSKSWVVVPGEDWEMVECGA